MNVFCTLYNVAGSRQHNITTFSLIKPFASEPETTAMFTSERFDEPA